MKGKHHIVVQNRKLKYEFDIKRNITIIKGDSATGKTTLFQMIRQAASLGKSSGVQISCDVECLPLEGSQWKTILQSLSNKILFIDEENAFIKSEEFAKEVQCADNYFVIITRENLYNLPYSVDEIYGIHASGKYHQTQRVYHDFYRIYPDTPPQAFKPDLLIIEDSQAGFEFFLEIAKRNGISCISAQSKTRLYATIQQHLQNQSICVIADGAAIGAEMERLYSIYTSQNDIRLYLPESFEWLLLSSGIIDDHKLEIILQAPEAYIESQTYFSWERFFTQLLCNLTRETFLHYNKSTLNPVFLHEKNLCAILRVINCVLMLHP